MAEGGCWASRVVCPTMRSTRASACAIRARRIASATGVREDPAVRAVILTGNGPAFSAGGNLKDIRDRKRVVGLDDLDVADADAGLLERGVDRLVQVAGDLRPVAGFRDPDAQREIEAALAELVEQCRRLRVLRDDFVLRDFIDEVLDTGPLPWSLIRWEMTGLDDELLAGVGLDVLLGYAWTEAEDVSPMTSSVAGSNFDNTALLDINNPSAAKSNYVVPQRFTLRLGYERAFFGDALTQITLFGYFNEGQPQSYAMNSGDLEGDDVFDDHAGGRQGAHGFLDQGFPGQIISSLVDCQFSTLSP